MTEPERGARGIRIVMPDPIPAGQRKASPVPQDGPEGPIWLLEDVPPSPPAAVPASVSSAQACLILEEDGLLDQVEAIVANMPKVVQIWFARANTWERYNPYVMGIGLELNLSDEAMDDKFRRAARRL